MELSAILESLFRWIHIVAGIVWIGHLYFFNFVNAPMGAALDGPTKQKVVPELMPRALYWFRWGAAWTWVTGVLLLLLVFWHGGAALEAGRTFGPGAVIMILVTFLAAALYDVLAKSPLSKNLIVLAFVGWILVGVVILLYKGVGFGYRGYVIHTGALFGTIMAYNVWMRIWPAQREIIRATKQGTPPDAAKVAMAGARSRHNTYLSVPLIWMMINQHTTYPFGSHWTTLWAAIPIGWAGVYLLYVKAPKVKGF